MKVLENRVIPEKKAVCLQTDEGRLYFFGTDQKIMRCVYTKKEELDPVSPLEITAEPKVLPEVEDSGDILEIRSGSLSVSVRKADGKISWSYGSPARRLLAGSAAELTETPLMVYSTGGEEPVIRRVKTVDGERNFVENLKATEDHKAYHAKLYFDWTDDEQIHGLGQGEEGIYDYRGKVQYLYQHNMRIPVPFLLSSKKYGVLFDCGSLLTFNDDARGSYVYLDMVEQLDFYFIAGDSVDEIIKGFRKLTGRAVMLPKWAYGYVQSKEKYASQDELVDIAKKYRELGVGLDCVVQDWKTWPNDDWGCKHVDPKRYPDLPEMRREMENLHVHTMVSVWPNMNYDTKDCQEMQASGHLLNDLATYDAFNADARALYWKQCSRELFKGFDSWWCDSTEPFSGPDWGGEHQREPWERFQLVGNEHKKFLGAERANLYAVAHAKGIYENQRKEALEKRVLNLTRSGYPGIQKYGAMLWSGDTSARWDVLRRQVTEGLNMALSGMPYWTLDIGGFFTVWKNIAHRGCDCEADPTMKWFWHGDYEEGVDDPGYRELYVRWLEFGAFLPMFRSHGTDTPREIWRFGKKGEPFYDAIAKTIATRYRLMPYIYSLAGSVWAEDGTIQRPLLFDFPDDPEAADRDDEYMFGKEMLIVPVTRPMFYGRNGEALHVSHEVHCYLPKGTRWYDFYTGDLYEGGETITVISTLDHIPVFVKEGSVIPMESGLIYADEKVDTPLELHIWPGADGNFTYYEDDGNGYEYEYGKYNRIPMAWDEKNRTLTIGAAARKDINNTIVGRKCVAVVSGGVTQEFTYSGEETKITF